VGVVSGEALIEEMVGKRGVGFAKSVGEGLGFGGLRAGCAVGVQRIADEQNFHFVLPDEAGYGFEVGTQSRAVEGEEWLRGETKGIGDGKADAAVADVKREGAGMRHGVSVRRGEAEGRE
jgi:hypothetical protein